MPKRKSVSKGAANGGPGKKKAGVVGNQQDSTDGVKSAANGGPGKTTEVTDTEAIVRGVVEGVAEVLASTVKTVKAAATPEAATSGASDLGLSGETGITSGIAGLHKCLDTHVSDALRAKVVEGGYIELGSLLHSPSVQREKGGNLVVVGDQIMLNHQKAAKIGDIEKWTDAFMIYISIFARAHPDKLQDLLNYMSNVRLGAKRYGGLGWKYYDEQYRMRKALDPSSTWAVDHELWMLYMYYSPPGSTTSRQQKCWGFNNGRCGYRPCRFSHMCFKCAGNHPAVNCSAGLSYRYGAGRGSSTRFGPRMQRPARPSSASWPR